MSIPNDAARCPGSGNETEGRHVMEHTKEPWCERTFGGSPCVSADDYIGPVAVMTERIGGTINIHEMSANARRIVACVNALAGVSTEWLEQNKSVVVLGPPIADRFTEIERQWDELLTTSTSVLHCWDYSLVERSDAFEHLREAIEKVKGGA